MSLSKEIEQRFTVEGCRHSKPEKKSHNSDSAGPNQGSAFEAHSDSRKSNMEEESPDYPPGFEPISLGQCNDQSLATLKPIQHGPESINNFDSEYPPGFEPTRPRSEIPAPSFTQENPNPLLDYSNQELGVIHSPSFPALSEVYRCSSQSTTGETRLPIATAFGANSNPHNPSSSQNPPPGDKKQNCRRQSIRGKMTHNQKGAENWKDFVREMASPSELAPRVTSKNARRKESLRQQKCDTEEAIATVRGVQTVITAGYDFQKSRPLTGPPN